MITAEITDWYLVFGIRRLLQLRENVPGFLCVSLPNRGVGA